MKNVVAVGVALGAALLVALLVFAPRNKSGSEFCPQTFEVRTFAYKANALQSYQMDRGIPTAIVGPGISQYLTASSPTSPKRWDLVDGTDLEYKFGNARILTAYIEASGKTNAWDLESWTKDNPKIAAELWPRVQTLAVLQMYYAIPELIEFALSKPSSEDFAQYADKKLLIAGSRQLSYLMAVEPTSDVKIRLARLIKWLEDSSNDAAEVIDIELQAKLTERLDQAKKTIVDVEDGLLSNEELRQPPATEKSVESDTVLPSS